LDLRLCQTWIDDLAEQQNGLYSAARLELQARLLRLAERLPATGGGGLRKRPSALLGEGGLSKVEHLAAHIAQHYQEPILIEDVAKRVGLHPNYVMNLFKKTFNLTINEFLTQHRLSHAQRLLATTDDKIIDVALEAGFPTLSRFYEAFKKSCGCSPSTYRREHRVVH
jgi:AraC-like DNA-binding protein